MDGGESGPSRKFLEEAIAFGKILVAQRMATDEQVRQGLIELESLLERGIRPLPTLGELLVRAGCFAGVAADTTLPTPTRAAEPGASREPPLPPEAVRAAGHPELCLGKFILLELLGKGGAGQVHRAWQRDLGRIVALKLLRSEDLGDADRLQREANLAARLSHRNIVRVYEGGLIDGRPFISMEFVRCRPLGGAALAPRVALEILRDVAGAVEYAHQQGVIHRDLKPSNLLNGEDGCVRVADFGVARDLESQAAPTLTGAVLGTPQYMPPEQARGERGDARSDVYSLGATLYALLSGRPPFEGPNPDLVRLKVMGPEDPAPLRRLNPAISPEIEAIVQKAMEKDPARRYSSAGQLAEDLRSHQEHKTIRARPAGALRRSAKWLKRHPILTAAGAVALLAAIVLAGATGVYVRNLGRARDAEAAEAARARAAERKATDEAGLKERALRDSELKRADSLLAEGDALAAAGRERESRERCEETLRLLERVGASAFPADLALLDGYRRSPPPLMKYVGCRHPVGAAFADGGRRIVGVSSEGSLVFFDPGTGARTSFRPLESGTVECVAVSGDGKIALVAFRRGGAELWDLPTGSKLRELSGDGLDLKAVALSRDGGRAATLDGAKRLRLWDLAAGRPLLTLPPGAGAVPAVALSPDGTRAALTAANQNVRVVELDSQRVLTLQGHTNWVSALAWSPDGRRILSGSEDMTVRLWDAATGAELRRFAGHANQIDFVAFSADGTRAASGGQDLTVRAWDLESGKALRTCVGHKGRVTGAAFSPDGSLLLSSAWDGPMLLWDLGPSTEIGVLKGHRAAVSDLRFSNDGRMLLTGSEDRTASVWDAATGKELRMLLGHSEIVWKAVFVGEEGRRVLTSSRDHVLRLWDLETGKTVRRLVGHTAPVGWAATTSDGRRAVSKSEDGTAKIWDLSDGACLHTHRIPSLAAFALSPDEKELLGCSGGGRLQAWDLESGRELRSVQAYSAPVHGVAFVPGGNRVAIAGHDGSLASAGWETGVERTGEGRRNPWAWAVAVSGDGRTALAGSRDARVRVWDLGAGVPLRAFDGPSGDVTSLAFSPDGRCALSGDRAGETRIWDFGRAEAHRSFEPRLREASRRLGEDATDGEARKTLADGYAFRGRWDLARAQLEVAREAGIGVWHLQLARCRWMTGDLEGAKAEFERALQAKEAPEFYLRMCLRALDPAVGGLDREAELKRRRAGDYPEGFRLVTRYPPARWTPERIEQLKEKSRQGAALTEEELGFLEGYTLWRWMQQYVGGGRKPPTPGEGP